MVVLSRSWQREWDESSAASISLSVTWDRRRFSEFALLACSVVIAPLIEIPFAPVSFGDPLKGLEWNFHSTYPHPISLKFRYVKPGNTFSNTPVSAALFGTVRADHLSRYLDFHFEPPSKVRFSFNIDIPMTMDQLRSTKQKANEIFLLGRSIPRNGDPFCRSIPLWLALLGMLLTILGHS
ncbi:hypothetical protein L1987_88130 [Smallanthus sonchifolius]|nr:hypothetical protein L1987_88130 [Smallanthus sonchifolius]